MVAHWLALGDAQFRLAPSLLPLLTKDILQAHHAQRLQAQQEPQDSAALRQASWHSTDTEFSSVDFKTPQSDDNQGDREQQAILDNNTSLNSSSHHQRSRLSSYVSLYHDDDSDPEDKESHHQEPPATRIPSSPPEPSTPHTRWPEASPRSVTRQSVPRPAPASSSPRTPMSRRGSASAPHRNFVRSSGMA
uniref:Uncharacterized protein n=1 Tax=Entomoneis paludosa TaxID=265537 RepID=A0A7S2VGT7_9STRA